MHEIHPLHLKHEANLKQDATSQSLICLLRDARTIRLRGFPQQQDGVIPRFGAVTFVDARETKEEIEKKIKRTAQISSLSFVLAVTASFACGAAVSFAYITGWLAN